MSTNFSSIMLRTIRYNSSIVFIPFSYVNHVRSTDKKGTIPALWGNDALLIFKKKQGLMFLID